MDKYTTEYMDSEERDLDDALDEIEINKLKKPTLEEQKQFRRAAKQFARRETKMNIRIDPFELDKIKDAGKIMVIGEKFNLNYKEIFTNFDEI